MPSSAKRSDTDAWSVIIVVLQWSAVVIEGGGLHYDAKCAHNAGSCEDPEEEAVQYHGHKLPVLLDLNTHIHQALSDNCVSLKLRRRKLDSVTLK